jgi:hypothetical protein
VFNLSDRRAQHDSKHPHVDFRVLKQSGALGHDVFDVLRLELGCSVLKLRVSRLMLGCDLACRQIQRSTEVFETQQVLKNAFIVTLTA